MESCRADQTDNFAKDGGEKVSLLNRTKHSKKRARQRGIREADLDLIVLWGSVIRKPSGAWQYFIRRKDQEKIIRNLKYFGDRKCDIQKVDKLVGKAVIVNEDRAVIITAYHRSY